ncbi:hypothetical protein B0J14DRAFT_182715 [Halenospora varia]|nr:hypothetical protein B0J14DRAFT_182715 [Halenospora varia]
MRGTVEHVFLMQLSAFPPARAARERAQALDPFMRLGSDFMHAHTRRIVLSNERSEGHSLQLAAPRTIQLDRTCMEEPRRNLADHSARAMASRAQRGKSEDSLVTRRRQGGNRVEKGVVGTGTALCQTDMGRQTLPVLQRADQQNRHPSVETAKRVATASATTIAIAVQHVLSHPRHRTDQCDNTGTLRSFHHQMLLPCRVLERTQAAQARRGYGHWLHRNLLMFRTGRWIVPPTDGEGDSVCDR